MVYIALNHYENLNKSGAISAKFKKPNLLRRALYKMNPAHWGKEGLTEVRKKAWLRDKITTELTAIHDKAEEEDSRAKPAWYLDEDTEKAFRAGEKAALEAAKKKKKEQIFTEKGIGSKTGKDLAGEAVEEAAKEQGKKDAGMER